MATPTLKYEIAFATPPDDPAPVWVDVTPYVQVRPGARITRGRSDNSSSVGASTLTFVLKNPDGRFTPEFPASPYYPNVKRGRKIRVTATHNAVNYIRFTGYIDEWAVDWPTARTNMALVALTASSRKARLDRGSELYSIIGQEIHEDGPQMYYPLGEDEGSIRAGSGVDVPRPTMDVTTVGTGTMDQIVFGTATGPGTDDRSAPTFTRTGPNDGAFLSALSPVPLFDNLQQGTLLLEAFFLAGATQAMGIVQADQFGFYPGTAGYLIATDATGHVYARNFAGPSTTYQLTSAIISTDSLTHHVALREVYDGTNTVATLFIDGVIRGTTTVAGQWTWPIHRFVGGGNGVNTGCFAGVLAHVAITFNTAGVSDARIQQHALSGSTGFSGERSDQRIVRLARYARVPAGEVTVETGLSTSIVNQITNDKTALSLMEEVVSTEGGLLFDARDGQLTFHARSHRYNAPSTLTLGAGEIAKDLEPKLDDQGLVNDMVASRDGGVMIRAVDNDSITEFGLYHESVSLLTTTDTEVEDAAHWKVFRNSTPRVRIPTVTTEVRRLSTAQTAAVLAREIGDRITLSGLPPQAPSSSLDVFVEGYGEEITDTQYTVTFNVSSADFSAVWQLNSSLYSQLGTSTILGY